MRITDVVVHKIAIADSPLRSSHGLYQPYAPRPMIELNSHSRFARIAETSGSEALILAPHPRTL